MHWAQCVIKGFIPWDDDVDIGLYQDDYEKMAQIINQQMDQSFVFYNEGKSVSDAPIGKLYDISNPEEDLRQVPSFDVFFVAKHSGWQMGEKIL